MGHPAEGSGIRENLALNNPKFFVAAIDEVRSKLALLLFRGRGSGFGTGATARGDAGASGEGIVAALVSGMPELVTDGIAASRKFWDFAAGGGFGVAVGLFPGNNLGRFET